MLTLRSGSCLALALVALAAPSAISIAEGAQAPQAGQAAPGAPTVPKVPLTTGRSTIVETTFDVTFDTDTDSRLGLELWMCCALSPGIRRPRWMLISHLIVSSATILGPRRF